MTDALIYSFSDNLLDIDLTLWPFSEVITVDLCRVCVSFSLRSGLSSQPEGVAGDSYDTCVTIA